MNEIGGFEDLIAWQKARMLVREVYSATRLAKFSKDFALIDQMRRAAISVLSNIAEGFERGGRAEFHQFLVVAKGSCAEVRAQLYVALDAGYLTDDAFRNLYGLAQETGKVIGGLLDPCACSATPGYISTGKTVTLRDQRERVAHPAILGAYLIIPFVLVQIDDPLAFKVILPSIAVVAFIAWLLSLRRMMMMEGTPTSKIASAAQGYVELVGLAGCIPPAHCAAVSPDCRVSGTSM